jgi:hypothetical protein
MPCSPVRGLTWISRRAGQHGYPRWKGWMSCPTMFIGAVLQNSAELRNHVRLRTRCLPSVSFGAGLPTPPTRATAGLLIR